MWFYMIAGFLVLVGIIGGVASGGIFTLIFIPLGLVMLIVAAVSGMFGRASQDGGQKRTSTPEPDALPHTPTGGAPPPATPENLVDARRAQQ